MLVESLVDANASSRDLMRVLRRATSRHDVSVLPESVAWQVYLELQRREEPRAGELFISALRSLHNLRSIGSDALPVDDALPDEHRMAEDAFLADLWKAYKKCIANNRTGPASQLLRDIEERVAV